MLLMSLHRMDGDLEKVMVDCMHQLLENGINGKQITIKK